MEKNERPRTADDLCRKRRCFSGASASDNVRRMALFHWWRSEDNKHGEARGTGVAHGVRHAGGGENEVAGGDRAGLIADHGFAYAFDDEVEFVLIGVRVRLVFLAGLKRVQARVDVSSGGERPFAHLLRIEFGEARDVSYKHGRTIIESGYRELPPLSSRPRMPDSRMSPFRLAEGEPSQTRWPPNGRVRSRFHCAW